MGGRSVSHLKTYIMKEKYGLLTPIEYSYSKNKKSNQFWLFKCDCGNKKISRLYDVKNGKINSCGCLHKKQLAERNKSNSKHGYFGTPTYESWASIIERCCNLNSFNYQSYGAKGITMCQKWRESFEEFLKDMGERPEGFSIDRIDVYGNYEPDNCRWASAKTQANNRTNNRKINFNNQNLNLSEWSDITGIKPSTISKRIDKYGWSIEEALTRKPR
jgi:hypothetical protein